MYFWKAGGSGTFNLRNRRGTVVVVVKIETLCWNRTIGTKLKMLLFLARVGKHRSTSRWVDITAWQRFMNSRRIVLPAFIFLFMTNRTFAVYHRLFAHAPSLSLRPTFFFIRSFVRSLARSFVLSFDVPRNLQSRSRVTHFSVEICVTQNMRALISQKRNPPALRVYLFVNKILFTFLSLPFSLILFPTSSLLPLSFSLTRSLGHYNLNLLLLPQR